MGKLLAVIKREYLERVRTKWFIITTVFGPVFFLGISVVPGLPKRCVTPSLCNKSTNA